MTEFEENSKPAPHSMTWFKLYQDAWIEGTRDLPLELRAVYFDCLCLIYKYDAPIARTDEWMSFYLHISTRKWRSVRCKLIALGKLVETEAGLTNVRAETEVSSRAIRPAKTTRVRGESVVKQSGNNDEFSENANEINKTARQSKSKIVEEEEDREKDSQPAAVECEAAPKLAAGWLDDFSIVDLFNDLADGDAPKAERWLIEHQHLGSLAIREAGERVKAERTAGKRVVDPLKLSATIAQRLKAMPAGITNRKPPVDVGAKTREIIANALRKAEQEASA